MITLTDGKKSNRDREEPRVEVQKDQEASGQEERLEEQEIAFLKTMQEIINETAVFGGGCFWCTETVFLQLKGVKSVMPGYTGGTLPNPTYEQVCEGNTRHVESVKIEFDPVVISFDDLLSVFFNTHDPTTLNHQGNDVGAQYGSAIFYSNEEQKVKALALVAELNAAEAYDKPVVTVVKPLQTFYEAEDYQRNFYQKNKDSPYCNLVIAPKLEKLQERFKDLLKE